MRALLVESDHKPVKPAIDRLKPHNCLRITMLNRGTAQPVRCSTCQSVDLHLELNPPHVNEVCENGHRIDTVGRLNLPQLDDNLPYFFYCWPHRYTVSK